MAPSPVCLLLNLAGVVKIGGPCAAFDWYYDINSGIAALILTQRTCWLLVVPILRCVLMLCWEMLQLLKYGTNGGSKKFARLISIAAVIVILFLLRGKPVSF